MAKTTTNFPKVGTSVATSVENISGAPSSYTKPVPKGGATSGADYPEANKGNRSQILERLGAKYAPQADIHYPNAPELSGQTQRNLYTVPSKVGLSDFWDRRQYGQTGDFG